MFTPGESLTRPDNTWDDPSNGESYTIAMFLGQRAWRKYGMAYCRC